METYTLKIDMAWRPISLTLHAEDDEGAVRTATELVSTSCRVLTALGDYRTSLQRADGSYLFQPKPIAELIVP